MPKRLSYDDFLKRYTPKTNHIVKNAPYDGYMYETHGKELAYVQSYLNTNPEHVFTIIETDGKMWLVAGWHLVNRQGYFLTNKPYKNIDEEYYLD